MSKYLKLYEAAERKGCTRAAIRLALERGDLHGDRLARPTLARGWVCVYNNAAFRKWKPKGGKHRKGRGTRSIKGRETNVEIHCATT